MPLYLVNTDSGTCVPYKVEQDATTIADAMELCIGATEWDSVVTTIQKWFYGTVVKDAWCCTGLSYFSAMARKESFTGAYENVDSMKDYMNHTGYLDCTPNYGGGAYKAKRGDVVFMSSKYTYADCTHVGVVSSIDHDTGEVVVTSCNCDNSIKQKTYNYKTNKYIVAWGRVD